MKEQFDLKQINGMNYITHESKAGYYEIAAIVDGTKCIELVNAANK